MTNVDFFRGYAEDDSIVPNKSAYYFEHNRPSLDFSALFQANGVNDTQLKLLHYTEPKGTKPFHNDAGNVYRMKYEGAILFGKIADTQAVIDTQRGTDKSLGIYETHIKPLVDSGGIFREIADYNNRLPEPTCLKLEAGEEVYLLPVGAFGTMNGIWIHYSIEIEHDTYATS